VSGAVRILELLDRLRLADAAAARGVKTTVEIYEQAGGRHHFPLADKGAQPVTPYPFALGLPQDETESVVVGRVANARPSVASRSPMSAPASSTSAAASGITCCCSRDQHPTRRHVVESLLSQYAVDITIDDVPAAEQALHACYGAHAPRVWLIRPDGHLAYSGAPEDVAGRRTYLDRIYVRQAPASDQKDGRSERSLPVTSSGLNSSTGWMSAARVGSSSGRYVLKLASTTSGARRTNPMLIPIRTGELRRSSGITSRNIRP
jgi:hypothetical protein